MPVEVSYPGVYIEEVPSGVRTIVGVATSIAAFLGRAASGTPDEPVEVNGIGEFEREFGTVSPDYPMSLAVRDFFLNGGSRAIVVRLFKGTGGNAALTVGGLTLLAASPGKWGEALRAEVTIPPANDAATQEMKARLGIKDTDQLFNLTVADKRPGRRTEQFSNLTVVDSPRRLDRVLEAESSLVRWDPLDTAPAVTEGSDPVTLKEKGLPDRESALTAAKKSLTQAEETLAEAKAKHPPDSQQVKDAQKARDDAQKARDDAQKARDTALTERDGAITDMKAADSGALDAAAYIGSRNDPKTGLYALEKTDLFNLLCIPPDKRGDTTPGGVYTAALQYCAERRAMLIVDPPHDWTDIATLPADVKNLSGLAARNAAIYFPRILQSAPEEGGALVSSVPCGAIAGIMARTDTQRGVWKAPAGVDANLAGAEGLVANLTDEQNGDLNKLGINVLRNFPAGRVVWGARTMRGANQLGDEYKYIPVRRLALFLEESLYRGTKWVVFEPNDEPLWAQIRLNVGAFLQNLFRQGAFQGRSPREAYFVKCDKDTTTQNDINLGIVNVLVGFAPLKPAEFVIIKLQQLAGQIEA